MKEQALQPTNQKNELATTPPPPESGILASDCVIPRILLMQGTSDFVKERTANIGDIVKSTTLEVVANPDSMVNFIPLMEPATGWRVEKRAVGAQRWEFVRREPRNAANDALPWRFNADKDGNLLEETVKSSHEWRRVKTLSLFAILPTDVAAHHTELARAQAGELPDLSKALSPVMIEFRSTSFTAGKEVSTFFTQVQQYKVKAWKYQLKLGCFMDKNDEGSFYVYKVDRNKPVPVDAGYLADVEYWANIVSRNPAALKVDEEKVDAEVTTSGNF